MDGGVTRVPVAEAKQMVQRLLDSGDGELEITYYGSKYEVNGFDAWLEALEHRKVIIRE